MRWNRWIGITLAFAIAVLAFNYLSVTREVRAVVNNDPRNADVNVFAYHRYGLGWREVVFDVVEFSNGASCADVIRILLQFAERMKDRSFSEIYLSHAGTVRFVLDGKAFQNIGREYAFQNPLHTLRTLPEKLRRPDGSRAFETWTGGWLGVTGQQMNDLNSFCQAWLIEGS